MIVTEDQDRLHGGSLGDAKREIDKNSVTLKADA